MSCLVDAPAAAVQPAANAEQATDRRAAFVVFSGEFDKLLMAFTLATGAAASGLRTRMFFTFWAVAALRTGARVRGKSLIDRMFGWMLPKGTRGLPMSRMQMFGLGPRMIRWRMGRKRAASLEELIASAQALGVEFVVCEASMDLMGFRREEMLPGCRFAGVAECLAAASGAQVGMVI